ncbi:uncharacterized protein CANTADRAFT_46266 [Suhomyces tanzawaensis NRRL Y-17324]|uniref:Uncharacterized protein n=1 Tax=Suhomyces tanzawaensis NRRL Y-17324 TaxID=984487 RepID=A0A1E4SME3_9ASCO|nr:uncharacterized protein CANTADRAFT_46266 [Suhomyces tanzawaensis NRRL Y-17324]ODV80658.1 hypothetical protein CANTADRAFT_46266 [Suhomyces tanzawaensis NRRL Y-17324]
MSDIENQEHKPHTLILDNSEGPASGDGFTRVKSEGEYIQFGNERYLKSELAQAFGGTLNPGLAPPPKYDLANPAPLGLSAFALTTFVLSLVNVGARGVTIPNIVVGLAFFYGGAAQLIAGLFEIAVGNTFGGVALCSYGGFWGSYAAILVGQFGIEAAYEGEPTQLTNALGIFLLGWFIFTFFMCVMTLKSTAAFFSIFFFLSITFLLLAIGEFKGGDVTVKKVAGVFGLITAFCAWYNAYAGIANPQNSYLPIKVLQLPDLQDKAKSA